MFSWCKFYVFHHELPLDSKNQKNHESNNFDLSWSVVPLKLFWKLSRFWHFLCKKQNGSSIFKWYFSKIKKYFKLKSALNLLDLVLFYTSDWKNDIPGEQDDFIFMKKLDFMWVSIEIVSKVPSIISASTGPCALWNSPEPGPKLSWFSLKFRQYLKKSMIFHDCLLIF